MVVVVVVTAAWLVIACPLASFRHVLLKCGIWGTPDETVQVRLHRAYLALLVANLRFNLVMCLGFWFTIDV